MMKPRRNGSDWHVRQVPADRHQWQTSSLSGLSAASEVMQARVTEALKVGAETYEGELEMDFYRDFPR
jgi:hypothetical protein